jgi:hypothetical protein
VPLHKELKPGTLSSIIRQSKLPREIFEEHWVYWNRHTCRTGRSPDKSGLVRQLPNALNNADHWRNLLSVHPFWVLWCSELELQRTQKSLWSSRDRSYAESPMTAGGGKTKNLRSSS